MKNTKENTTLGYTDVKSLLAESDRRAQEYALSNKSAAQLNRLYETFSLITAIVDTAFKNEGNCNGNKVDAESVQEIHNRVINEAVQIIDVQTDFNKRLSMLEKRYLQAKGFTIRQVS